ncbi:T-cell immunomodulatory protein-like [Vairimorpha necatrix]|uniref:T-cell immunomodulatory protein-like n=1 Tax=Vairimorpha necatrix TaxID=6039 RepID=A0AAX4JDH8_9MICR
MDIETMTVLIRNFILLGYGDMFNERKYDMIGTTNDQKTLVIHSYSFDYNKYEEVFKRKFDLPIYSCTPGNFTGNGRTSLFVTFVDNDVFINKLIEFTIEKHTILKSQIIGEEESAYPPMSITDYETTMPAIVIADKEGNVKIVKYDINKKTMVSYVIIDSDGILYENHPYSFVDLDGDLKAELVTVTVENDKKFLNVYKYESNGYRKNFTFDLPEGELGPIVFGDFTNKGVNSMLFINVSKNNEYFINLYINNLDRYPIEHYKKNIYSVDCVTSTTNPFRIFTDSSSTHIKTSFNDLSPGLFPVLKLHLSGFDESKKIPGGIFTTDIDNDGNIEFFVTVQNENARTSVLPLRLNKNMDKFLILGGTNLKEIENVKSFSTIDYDNRGKENIIINRERDGSNIVEGYNNKFNDDNMKLSLTATLKNNTNIPYGMGLPGTTYLLLANHGQYLFYSSNSGSGPHLNLVSQTALIGLGDSIYMIDSLRFGIASISNDYKGIYVISTNIIQNLDLIISAGAEGNYKVEAFFKIVKYFMKIVYVVLIAGMANVAVWAIISYNQNKRIKLARTKDSMHPLFRSL